ncbi:MAG: disulfide bond formation protein B [Rhodospirillales bacterium]|nr:disulfide bond formation protein B [Alphaproteobacteria bacterium]MCB9986227.1 disulfide bond formation protein B [Rhodospirillales bacterium]USO08622.1 MAG: disulfide bond formation protein B [Rhodospirillales bacterium]
MFPRFHLFSRLTPRFSALGLGAVSAGALAMAYIAQYGFGLEPCELCLMQRVPYALGAVLAVMVFARPGWARGALAAMGVFFLAGMGIAAFHVGVEQHWWAGLPTCSVKLDASNIDVLRAQILNSARVPCDKIAWEMFGISMAGYNVPTSAVLAAFAFWQARRA